MICVVVSAPMSSELRAPIWLVFSAATWAAVRPRSCAVDSSATLVVVSAASWVTARAASWVVDRPSICVVVSAAI